ncbi:PoNe immunity protein domain-containing protein [Saccharospirillum salsuginis]|nr:PoNe immunity protein domain-containing protein [Saccharospirillum salsuginis]
MRQTEFADIRNLEHQLMTLESKALPLFDKTLADENIDARRRSICAYSRFKTLLKVLSIKYTLGYDLESVCHECEKLIEALSYLLDNLQHPLDEDFDQYTLIVWSLSCAYLFNVDVGQDLIGKLPFSNKDMIFDRLVHCFDRSHIPTSESLFPKFYGPVLEALGQYDDEKRDELINAFLDGYLKGLKRYDAFWSDSHKEKDPRYYRHFGYWVFELAALAIDSGWDDSAFRDHPVYPSDLVDWKRSQLKG